MFVVAKIKGVFLVFVGQYALKFIVFVPPVPPQKTVGGTVGGTDRGYIQPSDKRGKKKCSTCSTAKVLTQKLEKKCTCVQSYTK